MHKIHMTSFHSEALRFIDSKSSLKVCGKVCVPVCMHVCVHVCTCICMQVCVRTCVHVCVDMFLFLFLRKVHSFHQILKMFTL